MMKKQKAFTLIEMLVVLVIITVLILIFVPNLLKQSDRAHDKGTAAFQQVVDNQMVLFRHEHPNQKVTKWEDLKGYLSDKQIKEAKENDKIKPPWK